MPDVRLVSRIPREAPVSQQGYHQPLSGGPAADRPDDPYLYEAYFNTDTGSIENFDGTNWVRSEPAPTTATVGITALRPVGAVVGYMFYDTTITKPVWWDGAAWRDAAGVVA